MKKTEIIRLTIIFCFIASSFQSMSQTHTSSVLGKNEIPYSEYAKYTLAWHPFLLLNSQLKIDFEKRIQNKKDMIQWSLIGDYYHDNRDYSLAETTKFNDEENIFFKNKDSINNLRGIGVRLGYKKFINSDNLYILASTGYNYYNANYSKEKLLPFTENGLNYYQSKFVKETQNFLKASVSINIGLQTALHEYSSIRKGILLDIYMGLGYSYSFYDKNKRPCNKSMYGPGYRGFFLSGGARIGFSFGK